MVSVKYGPLGELVRRRLAWPRQSPAPDHELTATAPDETSIYKRPDGLEQVWQYEITPLLEDLFYGQATCGDYLAANGSPI
jgi:hypothetical protein